MSFGFGFSLPAYAGYASGFGPSSFGSGASLALDFLNGNNTLDPRITFSRTTNATLTNSAGLIANAPMNLLTFSEQFDNAAWGTIATGVTTVANNAVAPNGTTTADTLTFTGAAYRYRTYASGSVTGQTYTFSVWVSSLTGKDTIAVRIAGNATGTDSAFSLVALTTTPTRVSVTRTFTSADTSIDVGFDNRSMFGGLQTTGSVIVWGAQLALGSTATTYNPTTVKNLLGYTEHFDNAAWTKSNATITSGFTDIYGQPFAQKLVESTATGVHEINQTVSLLNTPICISVYAKVGERSKFRLDMTDLVTGDAFADFDLTAVSATSNSNGSWSNVLASISSIGNGWYRCSLIATKGAGTSANAKLQLSNGAAISYTGDGTSGIYIFGAQLSDSASVDPYVYQPVAAPSSVAYYGPRFDYDPVTLAPKGLLIEEQRTNLLTYSEQFDNAAWVKNAATVTANATVSPDGVADADMVTDNAVNTGHAVYGTTLSIVAATTYTTSVYLKAGTLRYVSLRGESTGTSAYPWVTVDLQTGTVNANAAVTSSSISSAGNGWYRVALTFVSSASQANGNMVIAASNVSTAPATASVLGNAYAGTGSTFYVWGAGLEPGSFATSYIPTVASQVTRAADSASMIGNNFARWFNVNEGTVYAQADVSVPSAVNAAVFALGSTTSDIMRIFRQTDAQPVAQVITGGAAQATMGMGASWTTTAAKKIAFAYATNNFSATTNGGTTITDTSGAVPIVSQAVLGNAAGIEALNGHLARVAFYSRVLSGAEQKGITA